MLRLLATHGRLLGFGGDRKAGYFLPSNQKPSCPRITNRGSAVKFGVFNSVRRLFSYYRNSSRRKVLHGRYSVKDNTWNGKGFKTFYTVSGCRPFMTNRAQLARRRFSLIYSYGGPVFSPLGRMACSISLALTRFHVIPGILALCVGELALLHKAQADGPYFFAGSDLHMQAQNGHLYLSRFFYSILEGVILIFRAVYLAVLFFPAILTSPFAGIFSVELRKTWLHLVHRTLEQAGPAFIKWGQWAATRPDLFPNDLCMELTKLHSKAPAHSFNYTKSTIEKAFGRKLYEIFDHFEQVPVASGSIAQVHRASLRFQYPGQQLKKPILVAVKVRHPGVCESIKRDFMIINLVAKFTSYIPALNWLRLDESVQQFAVFMMSQVDLAREAAHLSRFNYNFRKWKDVSFPKPLYPLVHPAVLVETFECGEPVARYIDDVDCNTHIKRDLAHIGTHALLKMLLVDNFIHADMHPGNILVRVPQNMPSRKRLFRSKPHIIFLDVGMTAELSKKDRLILLEFFKAVALRDGRTAAECTLELSRRQSCPNPKAFIEELERTFTYWGTPESDIYHPAECMHQLLEQVRRHRVNIDGNVCTVMITILVLEGWQRKLDPDYDIMQTLKTLLLSKDGGQPIDYFFS
ncbi:putative aarF domain-containing protein kinase [Apostasia shenzhenica]|uniref:Putative aarF domain-containing protein kinase n=1 Tax=Apostasia shenzhenica TaxID=1088818 RepID=A0A2I0AA41_9ASPA|nr:putative aarF domain-containing protein kinase [Apostasia shenzhenica]